MTMPETDFYFAYGSNLNAVDFERWCARNGFEAGLLQPVMAARLDGYSLSFSHYSKARGGGALNVIAQLDDYVDGVVFRVVSPPGWKALDKKEGHPVRYQRESMSVSGHDGRSFDAAVYRVPQIQSPYYRPHEDYVQIVQAGCQAFGLCEKRLMRAAQDPSQEA